MFLDGGRFLAVDFEHQEVLFEFLVINSSSLQTLSRDFEKRVEGRDVSQEFREETNKTCIPIALSNPNPNASFPPRFSLTPSAAHQRFKPEYPEQALSSSSSPVNQLPSKDILNTRPCTLCSFFPVPVFSAFQLPHLFTIIAALHSHKPPWFMWLIPLFSFFPPDPLRSLQLCLPGLCRV
jgi:hypothetical protein